MKSLNYSLVHEWGGWIISWWTKSSEIESDFAPSPSLCLGSYWPCSGIDGVSNMDFTGTIIGQLVAVNGIMKMIFFKCICTQIRRPFFWVPSWSFFNYPNSLLGKIKQNLIEDKRKLDRNIPEITAPYVYQLLWRKAFYNGIILYISW